MYFICSGTCTFGVSDLIRILHTVDHDHGIRPAVGLESGLLPKEENKMDDWAYVSINLQADQGLVPTFTGRSGFIHQIASLYVYQSIKLLLDEIMED